MQGPSPRRLVLSRFAVSTLGTRDLGAASARLAPAPGAARAPSGSDTIAVGDLPCDVLGLMGVNNRYRTLRLRFDHH